MDNKETIAWLTNNPTVQKNEIKKYVVQKMDESGLKESWQKHYFLEDLIKFSSTYPKYILDIINDLKKEIDGVPMSKRYIAYFIDLFAIGLIMTVIDSFGSIDENIILLIIGAVYFFYFIFCTYKFNTTIGLFIFKIKIRFASEDNFIGKIFFRELIFLTNFTGIGTIYYFIKGPYWDQITNATVIWSKKDVQENKSEK